MAGMTIGRYRLLPEEATRTIQHRTLTNEPSTGIARCVFVLGSRARLTVADIYWDTGERDVRAIEVEAGGDLVGRLLRGGRIGVYSADFESFPEGLSYMDLAVMRTRPGQGRLPTAVRADYQTICRAAGVSVWDELSRLGGSSIGPRSELIGDGSPRMNFLMMTFPSNSSLVPAAVFLLTRVLPLVRRFTG
jgi:hypothetical protein